MFNFIKKQFIDVIQWEDPDDDTLMWRFPIADQEIQTGASLTVRESQMVLFVDEGKVADVFTAGRYTLSTQTLPVLTYLKNWDKFFESPFKSDIYFFNTKQQIGRRWGTAQPITIRDHDFGVVQIRSFGMYSYRVDEPTLFFKEISGVAEIYRSEQLDAQLKNLIVTQMASALGSAGIAFLDMAANQAWLSQKMSEILQPAFTKLGLTLESFSVESVSLPENVQKALDARMGMGIIGNLSQYTQYQTAQAIPMAAQNEGGLAGMGASLGAGVGIGQAMSAAIQQGQNHAPPQAMAPHIASAHQDKLTQLKLLLDQGLISQADYDSAKAEVLKQLVGI